MRFTLGKEGPEVARLIAASMSFFYMGTVEVALLAAASLYIFHESLAK